MGKVKSLEVYLHRKTVNQKQCFTPGGTAEMSAFMKDLIEAKSGDSYHTPIFCQFGLCKKQMDLQE